MTEKLAEVDGYVLVIDDDDDVWIDTDQAGDDHHDGVCLGMGRTALADAYAIIDGFHGVLLGRLHPKDPA